MRPHLEFASPAWSPWTEADKAVLEKIQRRAVSEGRVLRGEAEGAGAAHPGGKKAPGRHAADVQDFERNRRGP